jgi:hypothetical protein
MGWSSGDWIAFFSLHALTIRIADVWEFAEACRSAFSFQAFLGYLWHSVDQVWKWGVASGHAVQLGAAFYRIYFAISGAFWDWWHHHQRCDFWALFSWDTFAIGSSAEMSFLAGATGDTDARADGIGFITGAIASFALTVFFIFFAHVWHKWHGRGGWDTALFRWNAHALFVLQVAGFAEATNDALLCACWAWLWISAGWSAGRSATQEDFVFIALAQFWWISEEHSVFLGVAFVSRYTNALRVSQMSLLAEASDDAVLGAHWAWVGIGAVWCASRTACLEFFIVGAGWERTNRWNLHVKFMVGLSITFLRAYAFTLFVLQVSFLTETTDDALEGTN